MRIFEETNIKINLRTLIDSRMLLCANSGGGKSYAIRKILEEAGSDAMSIILDYEGEFKTLRERFDFLLIGPSGDVPLSMEAAHLLPQKLMELHISTIIDISDLKMHQRILYVKKFLDALMDLPKKYWCPCLVVVDEAHNLCGQQEKQDSTHSVIDLMSRGRKRGYCGILATQRISKLHKDAAAEANYYLVGRTSLDIDMNRAADILGLVTKEDKLSLRTLPPGTFYFFDPRGDSGIIKVKVAKTQTTHPKVGIDLRGKITPPTKKIKAMLSKLNDLPKEAEEKAKTLEELKQRNRELERELKKLPTIRMDEKQLEIAKKRGFAKAESQYKIQVDGLVKNNRVLAGKLKKVVEIAGVQAVCKSKPIHPICVPAVIKKPIRNIQRIPLTISQDRPSEILATIDDEKGLNRCERKILSLLYNNPQREFTKLLVGVFTGYAYKSGNFNNALGHLNTLGLIKKSSKSVIFNSGAETIAAELLDSDINLYETFKVDNWARNLPKCDSTIFSFLMQSPDTEFTKEEIGEGTGYESSSGNFGNAIGHLNSLGLIIKESGTIKLNSEIREL